MWASWIVTVFLRRGGVSMGTTMTIKSRALRATLLGAVAAVGFSAPQALGQENSPTTVIDIDAMLAGQGIIEIDLNRDEITDFLVEIVEIPFQPQFERILAETEFPPAEFRLPNFGDGLVATEVALVSAVESETQTGQVLGQFDDTFGTLFADVLESGDTVGRFERKFFGVDTVLLYVDTVFAELEFATVEFEVFPIVDGPSFGPFARDGTTGFVGLSLFNESEESNNFGFLEITRGSITVAQQGFEPQSGTAAQIGAVPVPAPLALLGFAIAGLFGLRRFKA